MAESIDEEEGRKLFGADADNYSAIRPPYPEELYEFLQRTGALRQGVATLELGAGNGLATRRLLELGADPLTALEPDERFSELLRPLAATYESKFNLIHATFEEAELEPQSFDLVAAATSFHWVRPDVRVVKAAHVLGDGGYLAIWWNIFGDPERRDAYYYATQGILGALADSPSGRESIPFGLDVAARRAEIVGSGAFEEPQYEVFRWTLPLSTRQVGALYATFSLISRLPVEQRRAILDQLMEIAERDFGGRIVRDMISPVYVVRRKPIA